MAPRRPSDAEQLARVLRELSTVSAERNTLAGRLARVAAFRDELRIFGGEEGARWADNLSEILAA